MTSYLLSKEDKGLDERQWTEPNTDVDVVILSQDTCKIVPVWLNKCYANS